MDALPLPLAGEGWGEGLLSEELPSSAFGTFSRKREKDIQANNETPGTSHSENAASPLPIAVAASTSLG